MATSTRRRRRPQSPAQRAASLANMAKAREARGKNSDVPPVDTEAAPTEDARAPAREASPSPSRGVSAQARRDCKTVLAFGIAGADKAAAWLSVQMQSEPDKGFWTPADQLDKNETASLVDAVYGELERHPKLVRAIADLTNVGVHGRLGYVVAMIALPRLIRHGLVAQDDPLVTALLFAGLAIEQQASYSPPEEPSAPVSVAPGADDVNSWGNGYGQVDVGGVVTAISHVGSDPSEQAG